jgi:DNA-binding NtrC family response regulator
MKKVSDILLIDDDKFLTASLSDFLTNKGHRVQTASKGSEGIDLFGRSQAPIVLLDQKLPDMSGVEVCKRILEIDSNAKIIFITAHATVQYAVEAMQAGAFNYLSKPFELEELLIVMDMAQKNVQMEGRLKVQDYERKKQRDEKRLIGSSEVMNRIREQMVLAAGSEANVLVTGETGVGKNVVAKGIHDLQEKRETFLSINCSAIPENLMEAEYFGHEKGVFTGAESRREGIFELADGGTLVLDEIGEIPLHLQSKLLSVLEDKRIRRIGGARDIPVDVRIIATTNKNLEMAIKETKFRQDLYYRLAVFNVHIPPLREHPEDIPEIARFFGEFYCNRPVQIPEMHLKLLSDYAWPGNIRELRNVIERASLLFKGDELRPADLLLSRAREHGASDGLREPRSIQDIIPLEEVKKRHIHMALKACSGNKSMTARSLGISLSTLKRKIKEMSITENEMTA